MGRVAFSGADAPGTSWPAATFVSRVGRSWSEVSGKWSASTNVQLFSMVSAFQATQELSRAREREAQIAAVYAEIRELRHELLFFEASPKDLLIELDRTEEQLQNGHPCVDQTRTKLQSQRNESAEWLLRRRSTRNERIRHANTPWSRRRA